jgi:LysR family glycine cleavage system transcriptional activator
MRRKIPSVAALMAFEAAARHQNFSRAAEELSLTQSAICRQVAALERFLGLKLFHRINRRLALTDAGRTYREKIRTDLDQLERSALDVMASDGASGVIELATLPTFANLWLIPRLPGFLRAHEGITVNMTGRARAFLFSDTIFDAAIHFGDPTWPETSADYLFDEEMVPVCSPRLLKERCSDPRQLASHTLLHNSTRTDAWHRWFARAGVDDINAMRGPRYELFSMMINAARAGIGIALVPRFLVIEDLRFNTLVMPHPLVLPSEKKKYYLVCPIQKRDSPVLSVFRTWLLAQAEEYRRNEPAAPIPVSEDVLPISFRPTVPASSGPVPYCEAIDFERRVRAGSE